MGVLLDLVPNRSVDRICVHWDCIVQADGGPNVRGSSTFSPDIKPTHDAPLAYHHQTRLLHPCYFPKQQHSITATALSYTTHPPILRIHAHAQRSRTTTLTYSLTYACTKWKAEKDGSTLPFCIPAPYPLFQLTLSHCSSTPAFISFHSDIIYSARTEECGQRVEWREIDFFWSSRTTNTLFDQVILVRSLYVCMW